MQIQLNLAIILGLLSVAAAVFGCGTACFKLLYELRSQGDTIKRITATVERMTDSVNSMGNRITILESTVSFMQLALQVERKDLR